MRDCLINMNGKEGNSFISLLFFTLTPNALFTFTKDINEDTKILAKMDILIHNCVYLTVQAQ